MGGGDHTPDPEVSLVEALEDSAAEGLQLSNLPPEGLEQSDLPTETTRSADPPNPENLVTIFCENDPGYRLALRADGVVLAVKNLEDPKQQWIKVDLGDRFTDQENYPAFILVNKHSGDALAHTSTLGWDVTAIPYRANALDGGILWSRGRDEGKGFHAIRTLTNIQLNLDADHGSEKHGGVEDGNRLILFNWNKQTNQKWKMVPIESGE